MYFPSSAVASSSLLRFLQGFRLPNDRVQLIVVEIRGRSDHPERKNRHANFSGRLRRRESRLGQAAQGIRL